MMWKGLSLLAANEVGATVRRNVNGWIFYAGGGLLALIGLVFLLDALHGWLMSQMSSIEANLVIAAGLLFLSICLVIVGSHIRNRRHEPSLIASTALITLPIAARIAGTKLTLGTVAIGAIIAAGALLGRSLGRR